MPEAAINCSTLIPQHDAVPLQPRARGAVALSVKPGGPGSVLDGLRMSGSLKCLFPRRAGAAVDAVVINTAGGITGGDRFDIAAEAAAGTALTLTTQAAERAHRAHPGEVGQLTTRLRVGRDARLHWLPQETILFNGSSLRRSLWADLDPGASLLLVEPLLFGRKAMGEVLRDARFDDRIEIRRGGALLFLDRTELRGDIAAQLARPQVANGAAAMAVIVLVGPDAARHLAPLRSLLPDTGGASLIGTDVLVARLLAPDGFELRQTLVPALRLLSDTDLPRCWML